MTPRRPASLRFRVLAGAVLWIGLALAAGGWVLVDLFRDHVETQARTRLVTDMEQLVAALAVAPDGTVGVVQPLSDPRFRRPLSGLYWQVGEPDDPAARSRSLWDAVLALPPDAVADGEVHVHRLPGPREPVLLVAERSIDLPGRGEPLRVAVAQDAAETEAAVAAFTRDLAVAFLVLGSVLVVAAAAQAALALRPIALLHRRVLAVRRGRAERVAGAFPAEVAPLVDDLNALLDHDRATVARARHQAGDLAHGLKTPLAIVAAEAEDLAAADRAEAAAVLREQVELMRRQIEANLARARAAASRDLPGVRAPVAAALEPLCRALSRLHGKPVTLDAPPTLAFRGDGQDLVEMAGPLVENAARFARTHVSLTARDEGDQVQILIDDDGPGMPPEMREHAFRRGVRLDQSTPGSGLGLSIVRDLAELYGGTVTLDAAATGGCRAVLRLPAAR